MNARSKIIVWFVVSGLIEASAVATPDPITIWYGDHWQQSLDLYIPAGKPCAPLPVAVYIHGGGWLFGDSSEGVAYVDFLIERGFAVASINYRWSNNGIFPAQIHDCKGAVRWLKANAAEYQLDANKFAAFGDSAGGHLAALLATSGGVASLEGNIGGNLGFSSRIQAAADFYGPTDLFALGELWNSPSSEISQLFGHPIQDIIDNMSNPSYTGLVALVNSANPITHITPDDPPFYIAHGALDDFVPPSQSQILHDALLDEGLQSTLELVPGYGHELPTWPYLAAFDMFRELLVPTPADINCDGSVNVLDLLAVIGAWGPCTGPCASDLNGDGAVNVLDLLAVIGAWN